MRRPTPRTLMAAFALMAMATTGCFGSFQATQNVYSWNKSVAGNNKWSRELVFLVIGPLVPVYGVAALLDVLIINSVEFWTGTNPMTASTKVTEKDGTKVVQTRTADASGRTEVTVVSTAAGVQSTTTMFRATGSSQVTATTVFADGRTEVKTFTVDDAGHLVQH